MLRWYNLTPEQIGEQLNTDPERGLTSDAAEKRLKKKGENNAFLMPESTFGTYLRAVSRDITVYMMIATAIMSAIFSQDVSAIVIIVLLVLNLSASVFFYAKSRGVLRDMARLAAPMSRVIRDGRLYSVSQRKIVEGDIVILGPGDIVPADARVLYSDGLSVLESNLTGEKEVSVKNPKMLYGLNVPVSHQTDMVFATTVITAGYGKVLVCSVGEDTYAAETGRRPQIVAHDKLIVLSTLKKYCTTWGLAMLFMILVLTALDLALGLRSRSLFDIFVTGLSLAVAAMTEMYIVFGYYVIGSGLAGALKKIGKVNSGAVIKNVESLEDLKKITTLVVPRRGGFFADSTSVERIWCSDTLHRPNEKNLFKYCGRLLKYAMLSSGYHGANKGVLDNPANDASAIVSAAEGIGLERNVVAAEYRCLDYAQITVDDQPCDLSLIGDGEDLVALARGDALRMLGKSSTYFDDGQIRKLTERDRKHITESVKQCQKNGFKTVGVISRQSEAFLAGSVDDEATDWVFEGYIVLLEPMLRGAAETVARCKEAGIHVIMLSEESSEQNRVYAQRLGIIGETDESSSQILTSAAMSKISDQNFRRSLKNYGLFEELTYVQKKVLIGHLQEEGEIVGFLGCELDDIKLISKADVGFTSAVTLANGTSSLDLGMNDSPIYLRNSKENPGGCEALKFAGDIIVSAPDRPTGGFNAMVAAICTSKTVYQNLMRLVKYLITSQSARFLIVLFSVLANTFGFNKGGVVQMFTAPELLFSGLIIDFVVVVSIAFQRKTKGVLTEKEDTEERLEKPLLHNFKPMFYGLIWAIYTIAAPTVLSLIGYPPKGTHLTSMVFVTFIITQFIVACEVINERSVLSKKSRVNRVIAFLAVLILAFVGVMAIPACGRLFDFVMINMAEWIAVTASVILTAATYEIYKFIKNKRKEAVI